MNSFEPFIIYWRNYGGLRALFLSPYFWAAIALTAALFPLWIEPVPPGTRPITALTLQIIPSLMAFSLGGMAIFLALSGRAFIDALREDGDDNSLFMEVISGFFHFLLVQTLALVLGLFSQAYGASNITAAATAFLLMYSVTSALAIAAMLINVSRIYNATGGGD